jgi:hypothetical protein
MADKTHAHWKIGKGYFIRTVTYHYTGYLVAIYPQELVLKDAAWIADDGRFSAAMAGGEFNEIEPWPDGVEVIIGRGSILDACERQSIPRSKK